jgi:hypothetical protein
MAGYSRMEITALCKRVEGTANSITCIHPTQAADIRTAVMLLRLTIQLADIEEVDVIGGSSNLIPMRKS